MIKPISRRKSTYIEHLSELRKRLIASLLAVCAALAIALPLSTLMIKWLQLPMAEYAEHSELALRTLSPQEAIILWFRVGMYAALLLVSPYLLYQLWAFVSPGLRKAEKKAVLPALLVGFLLALLGASFAYFLILPLALKFLVEFSLAMAASPEWTVGYYVGFTVKLIFAFALAFELPLLLVLMAITGLIEVKTLSKYRRHAIVAIFILAATITPPDPLTMLTLALPLMLLYEGTVLVSRFLTRKRR